MRIRSQVALFSILGLAAVSAFAASSQRLSHFAKIKPGLSAGSPARLHLPGEIISLTASGFADLRLFDENGSETPYVIRQRHRPGENPRPHTFELVSYQKYDTGSELIFKADDDLPSIDRLRINTFAKNFEKQVQVSISDDGVASRRVAEDVIFDYSAVVDLAKVDIDIPRSSAKYFHLRISNTSPDNAGEEERIELKYKGLQFRSSENGGKPFKVDGLIGYSGQRLGEIEFLDRHTIENPPVVLNKQGDSELALGFQNLPVEDVELVVENLYYYREVELWSADADTHEAYQRRASGVIYKFPGMRKSKNTLHLSLPRQKFVKLVVINGDNPTLTVRQVGLSWKTLDLYFVPEPEKSYRLFFGGDLIAPRYEMEMLIPNDYKVLRNYQQAQLDSVAENPNYRARIDDNSPEKIQKIILIAVVLLVTALMTVWLISLFKKVKAGL